MNKDELKAKLDAQRKWREGNPAPAPRKRNVSITQFLLAFFIATGFLYAGWVVTPYLLPGESAPTPTATATNAPPSSAIETEQASLALTVCAGGFEGATLHVRFEAGLNGAIRGYLTEGETVTVPLKEQGEPITKFMDDTRWVFVQSPIIGWVSASRLCK
jgi:hypothetical protein